MKRSFILAFLAILVFSCQIKKQTAKTVESKPTTPTYTSFCAPKNVQLDTEPGYDGRLVPLFEGMGKLTYKVTTKSTIAQQYFDQGLMLAYGFNHAEAARSFQEAINQDPTCAMCFWGLGWVLGPNYNAGMEPEILPHAQEAIANARLLMGNATPKEQALIKALATRYPKTTEEDPQPYYQAFADALRALRKQYPNDLEIAAMAAESQMDMHPWDLWQPTGEPQPWTTEIVEIIEDILAKNPKHPQAIHLYIHALEASPYPEKVLPYADELRFQVPGSGHLTHMPSHTYINTGHYHKGTLANERAVKIDSAYVESCHAAGIYPLAYYPHNWHFLAACAALEGKGDRALEASRYMANHVVAQDLMLAPEMATLQHYYTIPYYIMVKFAKWEEILAEPMPKMELVYPRLILHYARGMAFSAKKDLINAEKELQAVRSLSQEAVLKEMTIWEINKISDLVRIAELVLAGDMAFSKRDFARSAELLEQAIAIEDQLNYNEPPDWFFSVRHLLGNVLIQAGKYAEAEQVYRTDLKKLKSNGWALMGLHQSLMRQNKKTEAREARLQFEKAWQWAEVSLVASVL